MAKQTPKLSPLILDEASVIERHRKVLQQLATLGAYELTYSGAPSVAVELIKGLLQQQYPQSLILT
jgi:hypothetical protein